MSEEEAKSGGEQDLSEVDIVVLGTGLTECILSGVLSISHKKVFHLDRNSYYGGDSASLNLNQLYEKFKSGAEPNKALGRAMGYTVDLSPKFIMACGDLAKILIKAKVNDYLEWKLIGGSYVYQGGKLYKVPSSPKEAVTSSIILNPMEKNRLRKFLSFVDAYDAADPKTFKSTGDPTTMTGDDLYKKFGLAANTQVFVGHAIALYKDEDYRSQPSFDMVMRCKNYAASVARYGTSPYLYPNYGLGGLPEGFSRRAAVHGGTFMLNMSQKEGGGFLDEITYGEDGKVTGIKLNADIVKQYDIPAHIKCKQLVGDPSYFAGTDKVKKMGQIARGIFILSHPIEGTKDVDSCQIIIPGSAVGRKNDIYLCVTSSAQKVCPDGKFVACVSTLMEKEKPEDDLKDGLTLLGKIDEQFIWQTEYCRPTGDGSKDNCFITCSVDATTHFRSSTDEVKTLYARITGTELDLTTPEPADADSAAEEKAEE